MPVLKDIQQVVAAYVLDHDMHPTMLLYMVKIIQEGVDPDRLRQMTKDEIWHTIASIAPTLEQQLRDAGGLDNKECMEYLRARQECI
jgi:hypothetical protein